MEMLPPGGDGGPPDMGTINVAGRGLAQMVAGLGQSLLMAGGFAWLALATTRSPLDPLFSPLWDGLIWLAFLPLALWMLCSAARIALALRFLDRPVLAVTADGLLMPAEVCSLVLWTEISDVRAHRDRRGRAWLAIDLAAPGRRRRYWPLWRTRQLTAWVEAPFDVATRLRAHPAIASLTFT